MVSRGAFSAVAFYGVGNAFGSGFMEAGRITDYGKFATAIAAHGVAGCVTSVAGGGKCGPGVLSAAFSKAVVPFTSDLGDVAGTIASTVIGGTAAELGGGKFANGAVTGAFSYLFNHCGHSACWRDDGDLYSPESNRQGLENTAGDTAGLVANGALLAGASAAASLGPGVAAAIYESAGE